MRGEIKYDAFSKSQNSTVEGEPLPSEQRSSGNRVDELRGYSTRDHPPSSSSRKPWDRRPWQGQNLKRSFRAFEEA